MMGADFVNFLAAFLSLKGPQNYLGFLDWCKVQYVQIGIFKVRDR